MNKLLIGPYNFKFDYVVKRIDTEQIFLTDLLNKLNELDTDVIIIPAEQTILGCVDLNFSGIELIKHIRLTPELININKLPIILIHWHSIDFFINNDIENIFLYSPCIYRYRCPITEIDFQEIENLNQSLIPFLFISENDETTNSHIFKNKVAIEQFRNNIDNPSKKLIKRDLWYKKIFYKNYNNSELKHNQVRKNLGVAKNILLIDDLSSEWGPVLNKVLPNCTFTAVTSPEEILKIFVEKHKNIKNKLIEFQNKPLLNSQLQSFSDKCLSTLFDFILLDIYFSDKEDCIENSGGYDFLTQIENNDIDIPIFIFSATTKDFTNLTNKFQFIMDRYIKGITPISYFLYSIEKLGVISKLSEITTNIKLLNFILNEPDIVIFKKSIDKYSNVSKSKLNIEEKISIQINLKSLINYIHLFIKNYNEDNKQYNNKSLLEIIGLLGIIQEYRLIKHTESNNSNLSNAERNLIEIRNVAFHSNTNLFPNSQNLLYNWNGLSIEEQIKKIENAFRKTFEGLLFGF